MDVAAVERASSVMGDFKLKSGDSYVVPERRQVDAGRKRRQMVLLEEAIHAIKMGFNGRFLALRSLKRRLCGDITRDNARIAEINKELGTSEALWAPTIDAAEYPEERGVVSDADIAAWCTERGVPVPKVDPAALAAANAAAAAAAAAGGERDASSASSSESADGDGAAAAVTTTPAAPSAGSGGARGGLATKARADTTARVTAARAVYSSLPVCAGAALSTVDEPSPAERREADARRRALSLERARIAAGQADAVGRFDRVVAELRSERCQVESELKAASLRLLLLFRELQLLRDMAKRDGALSMRLDKAMADRATVSSALTDCRDKLAAKKAEIETWQVCVRVWACVCAYVRASCMRAASGGPSPPPPPARSARTRRLWRSSARSSPSPTLRRPCCSRSSSTASSARRSARPAAAAATTASPRASPRTTTTATSTTMMTRRTTRAPWAPSRRCTTACLSCASGGWTRRRRSRSSRRPWRT